MVVRVKAVNYITIRSIRLLLCVCHQQVVLSVMLLPYVLCILTVTFLCLSSACSSNGGVYVLGSDLVSNSDVCLYYGH